jgi:hypothetical protein
MNAMTAATEMQPAERAALRTAGRRAEACLEPPSPEECRRLAALVREPMNQLLKAERARSVSSMRTAS